jgi:hypothetical protein
LLENTFEVELHTNNINNTLKNNKNYSITFKKLIKYESNGKKIDNKFQNKTEFFNYNDFSSNKNIKNIYLNEILNNCIQSIINELYLENLSQKNRENIQSYVYFIYTKIVFFYLTNILNFNIPDTIKIISSINNKINENLNNKTI